MRDQFLAEVQFKGLNKGKWMNVGLMFGGKRYLDSRKEAGHYIKKAIEKFNVGVVEDNTTVVRTRVRHRQVTEWEEL